MKLQFIMISALMIFLESTSMAQLNSCGTVCEEQDAFYQSEDESFRICHKDYHASSWFRLDNSTMFECFAQLTETITVPSRTKNVFSLNECYSVGKQIVKACQDKVAARVAKQLLFEQGQIAPFFSQGSCTSVTDNSVCLWGFHKLQTEGIQSCDSVHALHTSEIQDCINEHADPLLWARVSWNLLSTVVWVSPLVVIYAVYKKKLKSTPAPTLPK